MYNSIRVHVPKAAGSAGMVCWEDRARHFLEVHSRHKLQQARLLDIRKKTFPVRAVKQRSRCPEAVKSPSLEKLKTLLDQPWATSPNTEVGPAQAGGWTRRPPGAPSNLECSMISDQTGAWRGVTEGNSTWLTDYADCDSTVLHDIWENWNPTKSKL